MIRLVSILAGTSLLLSACLSGGAPAPVVFKGEPDSSSPTSRSSASRPYAPPIAGVPAPTRGAKSIAESESLSEEEELAMLDAEPGGERPASEQPANVQTEPLPAPAQSKNSEQDLPQESLSEEEELAMLDQDPRGPAPVDLRPKVQDQYPNESYYAGGYGAGAQAGAATSRGMQEVIETKDRPASIKVKAGDTLFSLSEKYQVALQPLIDLNNLQEPYDLNEGQVLKLPAPLHYRVKKGDTLFSIARKFSMDFPSLAGINGIEEPYAISPDNILVLPSLASDSKGQWRPRASKPKVNAAKIAGSTVAAGARPAIKKPSASSTFIWPLNGKVVSRFGGKTGGMRNDGINIAATANAEIHAASAGTVIYSGAELKNYGRLILIRHANGWVTAYAHNAEVKVKEGAKVAAGEVIALAGSSGSVETPQLHFETRKGVKPVDPMKHLPAPA